MGERQTVGAELEVAEQQQVDVDRPRAVPGGVEGPAVLGLDRLADVEQGLGTERGADAGRGVEEVGLVEDLADGLGLVERGDGLDGDALLTEVRDGAAQMALALADVRAQADVADPLGRVAQTPSPSSSCSRSLVRSSVTSTPASSTR